MGQFKPMVKMETTEPTVELKLKKGGHVNMKKGGKAEAGHKKMAMGGGALDMMSGTPALVGRPAVNAPVRAPMKPSMASRRKAMMAKKPAMAMPPMKKGGMACAEGGETKATQKSEMSKMKGLEKDMKSHASKPASKAHKGLKSGGKACATGGVALGNAGGFKTGGVALGNAGGFKMGGMAKGGKMPMKDGKPAFLSKDMKKGGKACATGGMMDGGGMHKMPYGEMMKNSAMKKGGKACATGGVMMGNAGGYKAGGKTTKKAYATGGTVNSGKPVAMSQGAKKPSPPVSINQLSGTFKKGGKVTPAEGNLMKAFGFENKTAMKQAKAQSNEVYSKYGNMKMAGGGSVSDDEYHVKNPKAVSDKASRELEEALNPLSMVKELYGKTRNAVRGQGSITDEEILNAQRVSPNMASKLMDLRGKGQGSVTEREKSITVTPAGKKRGGRAC